MTDSAPAAAENPNDTGGPYQVSLKGIPYDVSVPDVAQFLSDCVVTGGNQGITLLVGQDGRPSGEAMVILETHGDMVKALNHDRQHMGSRYIEVMYISPEQYEAAMKVQPGSASDGDYIVRLRGLPYSAQVKDIVCLLNDCQIKDGDSGVMFTFSADGRPSGEAFVEVCSQEDLDKALAHNHENMGRRYVEVFKANRNQMNWDCRKEDKISSTGESSSGVVRLRGLPFGCTEEQISTFFTGLVITPGGITIQRDIDGRESGEAFVEFASKDDIDNALARDRKEIQHRYIEVFRSSLSEVKPFKGGRPTPYSRPGGRGGGPGYQGYGTYGGEGGKYGSGYERNYRGGRGRGVGRGGGYGYGGDGGFYQDYHGPPPHFPPQGPPPPHGDNLIAYPPPIHNSRGGFGGGAGNGVGGPPPSSHSVRMRGLPYSAKEKDITDFFSPLNVLRVNLDFDQSGRPSGEAEVYFSSNEDGNAAMQKNNQHIGHRYIELFLNSSAPAGGVPQYTQPQQTGTPAGGYQQQYQQSSGYAAPSTGTGGYQQQYQQNVGYAAPSTASHQPAAGSGYQPAVSAGYQPAASAGYQPAATASTGYAQPQASGQQQWGTSY